MSSLPEDLLSFELDQPVWDRFFTVAPVVVVSTHNEDGSHDLLTTHQVLPLAPANRIAFLAPASEITVANCRREKTFAVSFPGPQQVVETSLAASGGAGRSPLSAQIPVFPARCIRGVLIASARLFLECEVSRVIEDLGDKALVVGDVVAAHIDRDCRRLADRDDHELVANHPLLAFVAPGRFATIEHTDAFPKVE